jgi:cytochrome c biogenesis factor
METVPQLIASFSRTGNYFLTIIVALASLLGISGLVNICSGRARGQRLAGHLLWAVNLAFLAGFLWICWFHYQIHTTISLELPVGLVNWLNEQLQSMNSGAAYGLPLYDAADPPRYVIPLWIENEKYYFWFFFYAIMALYAHYRLEHHRFRAVLHLFLTVQAAILVLAANPFADPLPQFFDELGPWLQGGLEPTARLGLFMRLYPKMIFYYNAEYMWLHPPLLFIAYSCITVTFITSVFMLVRREPAIEILGYDSAKFGYLMLTLGMLLGYPWALKAWGPNWWWDPKICSSIMMWAVFSTYLHARLYANKPSMWYFSSILGILCFLSMIFTFVASFLFPGEHTFQ